MVVRKLHQGQRGIVLLAVLVFVLVTTLTATTLFEIHQTQTQREKEEQLLFVGDQYRRAIASYYNSFPPGRQRALPQSLDDLLDDRRFPTPLHHLRRKYADPMTGKSDWDVIRAGGGIVGVASKSSAPPLKSIGFSKGYEAFERAPRYSDWQFVVRLDGR